MLYSCGSMWTFLLCGSFTLRLSSFVHVVLAFPTITVKCGVWKFFLGKAVDQLSSRKLCVPYGVHFLGSVSVQWCLESLRKRNMMKKKSSGISLLIIHDNDL